MILSMTIAYVSLNLIFMVFLTSEHPEAFQEVISRYTIKNDATRERAIALIWISAAFFCIPSVLLSRLTGNDK